MLTSEFLATLFLVLSVCSGVIPNHVGSSGPQRHRSDLQKRHSRHARSTESRAPSGCQTYQPSPSPVATQKIKNPTATLRSKNVTATSPRFGIKKDSLQRDGLYLGFLPDSGEKTGTPQTIMQLNSAAGGASAAYGWYAQVKSGIPFDGNQLLWKLKDVKACNCVFQPAVMPIGGWKGLTRSDNSQAVAIAKVMKKFTDEGIPVWLRFAHEANWYQKDGTYKGDVHDFKEGWAAVAEACKKIAPQVKMWWTPNVDTAENYAKYAPEDMSTVHLVGVDYYPKQLKTGTEFMTKMKQFHDTYAVGGRMLALGETGLGYAGSHEDRLAWLNQITAAKSQLKNLLAASWFNYLKEYDYQLVASKDSPVTTSFKSFLKAN